MKNEMKHTPGPWTTTPDMIGWLIEAHQPAWLSWPEGVRPVPLDYRHKDGEANARLIAAAPDLLAACKAALAALSQPMTYPADIAASKKWLADAIARAEGSA